MFLAACGNKEAAPSPSSTGSPSPGASTKVSSTPAPAAKTVKDSMGHEVTVPANPQRIIASYLEDHLVALGVKPVAQWSVTNGIQDYLEAELKGVPLINYDLPPEVVASFNPDFIIIGSESTVQKGLYEQYAKIAPTYVIGDATTKDWKKTLLTIGELLNKKEVAEKALKDYEQEAVKAKEKLKQTIGTQKATILWLVQKQFYLVDETLSSGAVLYGELGITPSNLVTGISKEAKGVWKPITLEKLAEMDADHIFLVNSDKTQGSETLNQAIWKSIPAVKAGHVYEMDSKGSWLYSGLIASQKITADALKVFLK
ncbi:putative siderophore-binding lipoprotein YfiY precursor [compost metagenome]